MVGANKMHSKRLPILSAFLFLASIMAACGGKQTSVEPLVTPPAISVQITKEDCPSIGIRVGVQIAWTNQDNVDRVLLIEHRDGQGTLVDAGGTDLLQPGAAFSITLTEPGKYAYYCSKDRTAFGTITVLP